MEVLEKAYIVSPYRDERGTYNHTGVDVLSRNGNRGIRAVARGKVIQAENRMMDNFIVNDKSPVSEWAGNYIVLEHANGYISRYNHLAYNSLNVNVGEIVEEGRIMADEGESGYATGVHLDFEVKLNGKFIDPTNYALGKEDLPAYKEPTPIKPCEVEYLNLNAEADTWRIYPMGVSPIVGNECGVLYPSKFGGLSYTVKGYTMNEVAIIETRDYGQVQIFINTPLADLSSTPRYDLVK